MDIHFSDMVNNIQPGIFGALNEKKEELLRAGRKYTISLSGRRTLNLRLM